MNAPAWYAIAGAFAFGLCGYLATRLAERVYANDAPLEDGPAPASVPMAVLIGVAALVGAFEAMRAASFDTVAVACVVVIALCAAIWTDMTRGFIGDLFTLPALAVVLAAGAFEGAIGTMALSLAFATIPFAVAALLSKGLGMGWGDVKLVALGSALLDARTSILMYAAACIVACGVMLVRRRTGEPIAFAPYLAGAIAAGMLLPPPSHPR